MFTNQYFRDISQKDLDTKKSLLIDAINKYCGSQPMCVKPGSDHPPTELSTKTSVVSGKGYAFCKPGFSVLSCGIDNLKSKLEYTNAI